MVRSVLVAVLVFALMIIPLFAAMIAVLGFLVVTGSGVPLKTKDPLSLMVIFPPIAIELLALMFTLSVAKVRLSFPWILVLFPARRIFPIPVKFTPDEAKITLPVP